VGLYLNSPRASPQRPGSNPGAVVDVLLGMRRNDGRELDFRNSNVSFRKIRGD
jgi:hypothetical protein